MLRDLPLQTATANWRLGENDGSWYLAKPNGDFLYSLPKNLTDYQVSEFLILGRAVEKEAYSMGIKESNKEENNKYILQIENLKLLIHSLEIMNEELSEQLEKHISGE
jgi:hypothetical protein